MRARVRVQTADGTETDLAPGDIIGRLPFAALHLADPRVSEAHAMVSLRAGELALLALRRRFGVDGRARSDVVLEPGLEVSIGEGLTLLVVEVALPDEVLALTAPGLPTVPLPPVLSLFGGDPPRVRPRFEGEAAAVIFSQGARFRVRIGGATREIAAGDTLELAGTRFSVVSVPLREAEAARTIAQPDAAPRIWTLHHDIVRVTRRGEELLALRGYTAQIVSELAAIGQPAPWEAVARELWRDDADSMMVRRRWDMALGRLRHKLREAGLPIDLVRADGAGNVELHVPSSDRVEDRS